MVHFQVTGFSWHIRMSERYSLLQISPAAPFQKAWGKKKKKRMRGWLGEN